MNVNVWYEIKCDFCSASNWVCDGVLDCNDMSKMDIEGFVCHECGNIKYLVFDDIVLDNSQLNIVNGKKYPEYDLEWCIFIKDLVYLMRDHLEFLLISDESVFIRCNDLFYPGGGDVHIIYPEQLDDLEKALKDDPKYGPMLFCCRKRLMRPHGEFYKKIDKDKCSLYDACDPRWKRKERGEV